MTQTITKAHQTAISRHLSDLLGDKETNRAQEVLDAIGIGPTSTYDTLRAVTQAVVSEACTDAGVKIPALRRGAFLSFFSNVTPHARTCNRCGRLPVVLEDVTWTPVTATVCPVDSGLYESERVEVIRSWVDGREYPAGTDTTPERIPLTEALIEQRGVSPEVRAAMAETGASLFDILTGLIRQGNGPVEALATVRDPFSSRLFIDAIALREFAQKARGMFASTATLPPARAQVGMIPYPAPGVLGPITNWSKLNGSDFGRLQNALLSAFQLGELNQLCFFGLGENLDSVARPGPSSDRVFSMLQHAESRGMAKALFLEARRMNPGNPSLRALDPSA